MTATATTTTATAAATAATTAPAAGRPGPGMRAVASRPPGLGRTWQTGHLTGVLLPPAGPDGDPDGDRDPRPDTGPDGDPDTGPDGALRLHTDDGPVLVIDDNWTVRHERPLADRKRDRRRQVCPDGRPIYRHGDLPAAQLATKTMLKRTRRKIAAGQQPIASYLMHRGYAPLYAVADAVAMRPLTGARLAEHTRARTCGRCGTVAEQPHRPGPEDQRFCEDCLEPASADWWWRQRVAGRIAAQGWARAVSAAADTDPQALVLLDVGYPTMAYIPVRAETWDGHVLVAAKVCTDPQYWDDSYTRPADLADHVRALQGRRLIGWRHTQRHLPRLLEELRSASLDAGGTDLHADVDADLDLVVADGDEAGPRWDEWCAERRAARLDYPFSTKRGREIAVQLPPSWRPPDLLGHIRGVVAAMAASHCYWWRAACGDPACGAGCWSGSAAERGTWSDRHHADTGHVISHTCTDGMVPPGPLTPDC